jgi:hypothetical protein
MYIPDMTIDSSRFEIPSYCPGGNPSDPGPDPDPETPVDDDDGTLATVEVAGIAVGCVAGVALVAGAFVFSRKQNLDAGTADMNAPLVSSSAMEENASLDGSGKNSAAVLSGY